MEHMSEGTFSDVKAQITITLTHSMLYKISADEILKYFPRKHALASHANCLKRQRERVVTVEMKYLIYMYTELFYAVLYPDTNVLCLT